MKKNLIIALAACLMATPVAACTEMAHWANLRDDAGNIIGTVCEGADVDIIGTCADNPGRTMIYDPCTGCYGSVASVYLFGGSDYEYEHPLEYAPECGEMQYCGEYQYTPDSEPCPVYEPQTYDCQTYDESTPWAADNLDYLEGNTWDETCDYCTVGGYEDEDDYFVFYEGDEVWVDVDITNQVINVYQGGQVIISGSCVTGTEGVSETPCGTFSIQSKTEDATLSGYSPDGQSYSCPVDYWMPFYEGCGLHDATWRDGYGGDIYQYDGSHGCVNLDWDTAQAVYETVPTGSKVCVHR